jgi:hypothetical protein
VAIILIAGRYRVDYKIGAGGFGLVYSGTALSLFASAVRRGRIFFAQPPIT